MKRVARVLLEVDDDKLKEWAEEAKELRSFFINDCKHEAEVYLSHNISRCEKLGFIEWENFCPKCESTELKQGFIKYGSSPDDWIIPCECLDCGNKFTNKDCEI